jgi:hypothetical protein
LVKLDPSQRGPEESLGGPVSGGHGGLQSGARGLGRVVEPAERGQGHGLCGLQQAGPEQRQLLADLCTGRHGVVNAGDGILAVADAG